MMHARDKAAAELGFHFHHVAGCVVNEKLVSQIEKHNRRVDRYLSKKVGNNWKVLVGQKEDSIFHADTLLIHNFYQTNIFSEWHKDLPEIMPYYEFRVYPTEQKNVFYIKAGVMDGFPSRPTKTLITVRATYPELSYQLLETSK